MPLGQKTFAPHTQRRYYYSMNKFLKSVFCLSFLATFLLAPSTPAHAQKWRTLKKALFLPQIQTQGIILQTRLERTVLRAVRRMPKRPYPLQVSFQQGAYHFTTPSTLLAPAGQLTYSRNLPPFPLPNQKNEMYRGMMLDEHGDDLRHILKNGLEVSKSHYEIFAPYNGVEYPEGTKAIYAAATFRQAIPFLIPDAGKTGLSVLLHLKRVGWRPVVSIPHDIPPSWILRVSALLNIDGQLRWGELKLNKDGTFSFFPYPPAPVSSVSHP